MLRIEDLNKKYPTGDEALKDVKLEVPKGQVMALIGPSGAGKSTLIRCVNRLVEPTKGKVFLGELELTKLSRWKLRQARRRMGDDLSGIRTRRTLNGHGKCFVWKIGLCRFLA